MKYSAREMMIVTASRLLRNDDVCLVGIGVPSAACLLALQTHAPRLRLIYESGTIETRPRVMPLSIGDSELCEKALTTVSLPEMFRYWLQGGKVTTGFLGAAQIDRYANLNTTVIGDYAGPQVRLPGAGGASEIAACCRQVYVILELSSKRFVEQLPFVTTFGHGQGGGHRTSLGLATNGPTKVITDFCTMEPDSRNSELTVTTIHPGVTLEEIASRCGWPVKFSPELRQTEEPSAKEIQVLRQLEAATNEAHKSDSIDISHPASIAEERE